jgi:class 3 adenylate cyclase
MAFKDELQTKINTVFSTKMVTRAGTAVPTDTSVTLGSDGVEIDAVVLYADLSESTKLVDSKNAWFAAQVYKAYLLSAAQIIRDEGGEVTAFDGDRVMGVFVSDYKNTRAVRAALRINTAVQYQINPAIAKLYGAGNYTVKHVVGIDTSKLLVAKTGIRGANDLVWIGRAANYAAKLCNLKEFPIWVTKAVYDMIAPEVKKATTGENMWNAKLWTAMNNHEIYGTSYHWNY